jgi:predicted PurR-regulated permease PerM
MKKYKYLKIGAAITLGLIIIYFIIRIKVMRDIFNLLLISYIISYTLKPLKEMLMTFGLNKKLAVIILLLGGVDLLLLTFIILIPNILKESLTFNNTLSQFRNMIEIIYSKLQFVNNNKIMYKIFSAVYEKMDRNLMLFFSNTFDSLFKLGENILSLVVIPVIVYYFLTENERIVKKLIIFVPVRSRTVLKQVGKDIDKVLGKYIICQFLLSLLIGGITFFLLLALKVEYPLLLSILNGIFNIIPYFGPLFGAIPAVLMAFIKSPQIALWTAISLYILQQIEGDIISPKITGDSVSMHPLMVIILLIIGGKIGGFIGMVLAVPFGVILKVIYDDLNYYIF